MAAIRDWIRVFITILTASCLNTMHVTYLMVIIIQLVNVSQINGDHGAIKTLPKQLIKLHGDKAVLSCFYNSSIPNNHIEWTYRAVTVAVAQRQNSITVHDGDHLMESYVRGERHSVLHESPGACDLEITRLNLTDAGTYRCAYVPTNSRDYSDIELTVIESPRCTPNISLDNVLIDNECDLSPDFIGLTCSLKYKGHISPILQWRISTNPENVITSSKPQPQANGVMPVTSVTLPLKAEIQLNRTHYICSVKDIDMNMEKSVCSTEDINVAYIFKPEPSTEHSSESIDIVTIKCVANTSSRQCDYRWHGNISPSNASFKASGQNLQLNKFMNNLRCEYECEIPIDRRCSVTSEIFWNLSYQAYDSNSRGGKVEYIPVIVSSVILGALLICILFIVCVIKSDVKMMMSRHRDEPETSEESSLQNGPDDIQGQADVQRPRGTQGRADTHEQNRLILPQRIQNCYNQAIVCIAYLITIIIHFGNLHLIGAEISTYPTNLIKIEGDSAVLHCESSLSNPYSLLQWRHWKFESSIDADDVIFDEEFFEDIGRHSIRLNASLQTSDLHIQEITIHDAGTYICANFLNSTEYSNIELTVLVSQPNCGSNISLTNVLIENDCNLPPDYTDLSCSVGYRGQIAPILEWFHSEKPEIVIASSIYQPQSNGIIRLNHPIKPTYDMNGTYFICSLEGVELGIQDRKCMTQNIMIDYIFRPNAISSDGNVIICIANTSSQQCDYKWHGSSFEFSGQRLQTDKTINNLHCATECEMHGQKCNVTSQVLMQVLSQNFPYENMFLMVCTSIVLSCALIFILQPRILTKLKKCFEHFQTFLHIHLVGTTELEEPLQHGECSSDETFVICPLCDAIKDWFSGVTTCAVCLGVFDDPRNLNCSHTFCLRCLQKILENCKKCGDFQNIIKCPKCRAETKLPDGQVEQLQKNWDLQDLPKILSIDIPEKFDRMADDFETTKLSEIDEGMDLEKASNSKPSEKIKEVCKSVCKILIAKTYADSPASIIGSGFLFKYNKNERKIRGLITTNHVINKYDFDNNVECKLQFESLDELNLNFQSCTDFVTNNKESIDLTFFALPKDIIDLLDKYGAVWLEKVGDAEVGDKIAIIQHLAFVISQIDELSGVSVYYEANIKLGSSGSPVVKMDGSLVGVQRGTYYGRSETIKIQQAAINFQYILAKLLRGIPTCEHSIEKFGVQCDDDDSASKIMTTVEPVKQWPRKIRDLHQIYAGFEMQSNLRKKLDDNRRRLISELDVSSKFLASLLKNGVITDEHNAIIQSMRTPHEKVDTLIDILRRRDDKSYYMFCDILRGHNSDLADLLSGYSNLKNDEIKRRVRSKFSYIVSSFDPKGYVLDGLFERDILTVVQHMRLDEMTYGRERCRDLLLMLNQGTHPAAYEVLLQLLEEREDYKFIADIIRGDIHTQLKRMTDSNKEFEIKIKKCYTKILASLDPKGHVVDKLFERGVITPKELEDINHGQTSFDRAGKLLSHLFTTGHPQAFVIFEEALQKDYEWVAMMIDECEVATMARLLPLYPVPVGYDLAQISMFNTYVSRLLYAVEQTWWDAIGSEFFKEYFGQLCISLFEESNNVYPPPESVFAWTRLTPIFSMKVVIIGQDPYFNKGQAHGLAFSVPRGNAIPRSLAIIYNELKRNYPNFVIPVHGDLTGWAQQGVLLLNGVLTVVDGSPNSHRKLGWETFTDAVISWLNLNTQNTVFMLWGKNAQRKRVYIDVNKHYVLQAPHPTSHRGGFYGCNHFSFCDQWLVNHGLSAINWNYLP